MTARTWQEGVGGDDAAGGDHDHWAHHDLVVLQDGRLLTPAPDGGLLVLRDGVVERRIPTDTNEIHGLTAVVDTDGTERVWIADPGFAMQRSDDGSFLPGRRGPRGPRALLVEVDGTVVRSISRPPHPAYEAGMYLPTAVAVDEERHGGSGDVWIADGYGSSLVHRVDPDGALVCNLDGLEGAGRFDCPHSIFVDRRAQHRGDGEAVLLVADRGNARVQVYGLDGTFQRCLGEDELTSPSAFAVVGTRLVIAELEARVVVLDADDRLVEVIGEHPEAVLRPGWPNALDGERVVRPPLDHGRFNSPHGLAVDADGTLYVNECLIGGRVISISGAWSRHRRTRPTGRGAAQTANEL